jgi:hypothetical protein
VVININKRNEDKKTKEKYKLGKSPGKPELHIENKKKYGGQSLYERISEGNPGSASAAFCPK